MRRSPSKLVPFEEAVGAVPVGASLTMGGFAHSHQPMAFTRALIRRGIGDLTLMGVAECWVAEFLAAAGMLRRTYMSNFMLEGFGRCYRFSRAVETAAVQVEDHSHFGMILRLVAGGLGIPFLPLRSMTGTDLLETAGFEPPERKWARIPSPFTDEEVTTVSALRPDVAVIHAARADPAGNVQLFGPTSVIEEQVRAARTVIVTVEEIVADGVIRNRPELTLIPSFMIDLLVHLPMGAHPTGVYGYYDHDATHLAAYYAASREDAELQRYLDEWVFGLPEHAAYLQRIGARQLLGLRVDPGLGYLPPARPQP